MTELSRLTCRRTEEKSQCAKQDKPFKCSVRETTYSKVHVLKRHEAVHTGVRPFVCAACGRRFTTESVLQEHRGETFPVRHLWEELQDVCSSVLPQEGSLARAPVHVLRLQQDIQAETSAGAAPGRAHVWGQIWSEEQPAETPPRAHR